MSAKYPERARMLGFFDVWTAWTRRKGDLILMPAGYGEFAKK
jgi:hypothetical protein